MPQLLPTDVMPLDQLVALLARGDEAEGLVRLMATFATNRPLERPAIARFMADAFERIEGRVPTLHDLKHWIHARTGDSSWGA